MARLCLACSRRTWAGSDSSAFLSFSVGITMSPSKLPALSFQFLILGSRNTSDQATSRPGGLDLDLGRISSTVSPNPPHVLNCPHSNGRRPQSTNARRPSNQCTWPQTYLTYLLHDDAGRIKCKVILGPRRTEEPTIGGGRQQQSHR